MKNKNVILFIFFLISFNLSSQIDDINDIKNDSLIIGSWSLYSRDFDGNETKFEPNEVVISFSEDKSFERITVNSKSKGRWTWKFDAKNKVNYNSIDIIRNNTQLRGLEFYEIIELSDKILILSNKIGVKISISKYIKNEN